MQIHRRGRRREERTCLLLHSSARSLSPLFMKEARLLRLFHPRSHRCFDVAVDHGFFNERAFLAGIESLDRAIRTLVAAAPDAIQLTVGQAPILQAIPGKLKPALVLRTDVANVYGRELPRTLFSRIIEQPVEAFAPFRIFFQLLPPSVLL